MSRSSDSDIPPSPEPADDHQSIIPGLDPVQLDGQDLAPGADIAASGDPGTRKGGRGRMFAYAGGGAALVIVVAVLALSHHGGQPGTAAAGTGQATTAPAQPGATAEQSPQSRRSAPAGQAGALPSAPHGVPVAATGRGSTSQPLRTHTGRGNATATGPARHQTPAAPVDPVTSGELPPLAGPFPSPTDSPNPVPPVPADRAVTVNDGPAIQSATGTCAAGMVCHSFNVSVADFPAHVLLAYTCADNGGVWSGPSTIVNRGTIETNSSGAASFTTYCTHPLDGTTVTINVGGGGLSASGRYTT
ncbi:MAG TPA: hypothetical protein VHT26_10865 [Trebonia sp.]|nr:hypothetical protein [Trebonia sp.]